VNRSSTRLLLCAWGAVALSCATVKEAPPAPIAAPAPPAPAASPAPAAPAAPAPGLSFAVEPADAEIVIDGKPVGRVSDLAGGHLALPPGLYQVSLKRAGYATWRAEVAVRSGAELIRVTLTRK